MPRSGNDIFVGRRRELAGLHEALERSRTSGPALVLIEGEPGTGKSALIRRFLHQAQEFAPILLGQGTFRATLEKGAHAALDTAFSEALCGVLSLPETQVSRWKQRIRHGLGDEAGALCKSVSGLSPFFDTIPAATALEPVEAFQRGKHLFSRLALALSSGERPLVLFLDDLQWADEQAIGIIFSILAAPQLKNTLILGACRGNEVDESHPLRLSLQRHHDKATATLTTITLKPLDREELAALLPELLDIPTPKSGTLVDTVFAKTRGNPLYTCQMAHMLIECAPLTDGADIRAARYAAHLAQCDVSTNVADFLVSRISVLETRMRRALFLAACFGIDSEPAHLEALAGRSISQRDIERALQQGEQMLFIRRENGHIRFAHDRIHQAFYESEPERERAATHAEIALLLFDTDHSRAAAGAHIVKAVGVLKKHVRRHELARFCLKSGNTAKGIAAFGEARSYYLAGMELTQQKSPTGSIRELRSELSLGAAECCYLTRRFETAEEMLSRLLCEAGARMQRLRVMLHQVRACLVRHRCDEATTLTVRAMREYGLDVPEEQDDIVRQARDGMHDVSVRIERMGGHEAILKLPELRDEEVRLLVRIVCEGVTGVYYQNSALLVVMFTHLMRLTIEHGVSEHTPITMLTYAFSHCVSQGCFDEAYELSHAALIMARRLGNNAIMGQALEVFAIFHCHVRESLQEMVGYLREGLRVSIATGDLLYAGLNAVNLQAAAFVVGTPLGRIAAMLHSHRPLFADIGNEYFDLMLLLRNCQVRALAGKTMGITGLAENEEQEQRVRQQCTESPIDSTRFHYHYIREQLLVYAEDFRQALMESNEAERMASSVRSLFTNLDHRFFRLIAMGRVLCTGIDAEERARLTTGLHTELAELKQWADICPRNYRCRYRLADAHAQRAAGDAESAVRLCEQAIEDARPDAFITVEALSHSFLSELLLERQRPTAALIHLREAEELYQRWGASALVELLRTRHGTPELTQIATAYGPSPDTSHGIGQPGSYTAIEASRIVAECPDMHVLARKLLNLLCRATGASSGVLCVGDQASVSPLAGYSGGVAVAMQDTSIDSCTLAAPSVIRTAVSSGTTAAVADLSRDHLFRGDKVLNTLAEGSCAAVPLKSPTGVAGALFLLFDRPGACSAYQIEYLELLLSAIAPSFANARLHQHLEETNERLQNEIAERRTAEKRLRTSERALERKSRALEKKNDALRQVLAEIEAEKVRARQELIASLQGSVLPGIIDTYLAEKKSGIDIDRVSKIHSSIEALAQPSTGLDLADRRLRLTPREYEIANMVRAGLGGKEIARILHIDYRTVERHRNTIRRKLGLTNSSVNLATYLRNGHK